MKDYGPDMVVRSITGNLNESIIEEVVEKIRTMGSDEPLAIIKAGGRVRVVISTNDAHINSILATVKHGGREFFVGC